MTHLVVSETGYSRGTLPAQERPVPKVSVYVPDDLYRRARDAGLSLSAVTQAAIDKHLERAHNDRWIAEARSRSARVHSHVDTAALLEAARDEFGA